MNIKNNFSKSILGFITLSVIYTTNTGFADNNSVDLTSANPQELARGIGHFERSRSLLLAAIREFDEGYKEVKTDKVLDADAWRKSLLQRAKDLETILSPKPREIRVGSKYSAEPGLLGQKRSVSKPNIKKNQEVKPEVKDNPEAKSDNTQIDVKSNENLELSGS